MTTYRWSFEEDVACYCQAGLQAIGVWRQKLSDFGEEKGIELLKDSGLQVSNLLWAGGFTGSDGRTYREALRDAAYAIQLAAEMRADCLVVYSGARAGHTQNHARRLLREALRELRPIAEEFGVKLAVEPMHSGCAEEFTFLTDFQEAAELTSSLESPYVGLVFDTYHLGHQPQLLTALPKYVDQICIVHLGDARHEPLNEQDRCRLGEGCLPLQQIIETLERSGYNGYYDVELLGEEIETADYTELVCHSRDAWKRLGCRVTS